MKQAELRLKPLTCPSCIQKIEGAIRSLDGIEKDSIDILFNSGRVRVNYNSNVLTLEDILNAVERVGYPVERKREKAI